MLRLKCSSNSNSENYSAPGLLALFFFKRYQSVSVFVTVWKHMIVYCLFNLSPKDMSLFMWGKLLVFRAFPFFWMLSSVHLSICPMLLGRVSRLGFKKIGIENVDLEEYESRSQVSSLLSNVMKRTLKIKIIK